VLANRDYPILFPAVEAAGFRFTGYETGLLDLQSLVFVVALLVAFVELVAPRAPRWASALPILIVLAPSLADQLASAEADIPLAAFFACAAAAAFLWWRDRDRPALVVFGVLCAGVAATKAEGAPFVIALTVPFAIALARSSRAAAGALAGVAVLALALAVVPWRLWVDHHDIPQQTSFGRLTDASLVHARADRVPIAARYLVERFVDPRAWLLLVPLLAVLTVLAWLRGRRGAAAATAGVVVLCFAALVLAYWTSQFEIHYHLQTSARRVIDAPILAWAFLIPLVFGPNRAFTAPLYPQVP
jgi:4-amino-4-deoxy-L-arabinose transferase-like glycosyltransferase